MFNILRFLKQIVSKTAGFHCQICRFLPSWAC